MIPKSGCRFSEKIMLKQYARDDASKISHPALASGELWRAAAVRIVEPSETTVMKRSLAIFAVAALAVAAASPADAKGCLKGAVVGGVAGHYAGHHGVLGAVAGCVYGRHHAKEQARQQNQAPNGQERM
jgi:hypothetical protein